MRKLACLLAAAALFSACDPTIKTFDVVPKNLQCPGPVTLSWEGDGNGGHLDADQPVSPALPVIVTKKGTKVEQVSATTTFTFFYPSSAHREKTVTVAKNNCGGGCGVQTLLFTGTCASSNSGPSYGVVTVSAANAPGQLVQLTSDATFPVHVLHAGQDIALGAGGGPIVLPLPVVPAAGDYTITVPGQVGQNVCADAGPTSGTTDAPPVHLFLTPTCPP